MRDEYHWDYPEYSKNIWIESEALLIFCGVLSLRLWSTLDEVAANVQHSAKDEYSLFDQEYTAAHGGLAKVHVLQHRDIKGQD